MMKNKAIPISPELQEVLLEAPALISLAAAGRNRKKKEEAKQAALKLFHTETFAGPVKLQEKLQQAEPFFEETFERIDRSLPNDPGARNTTIRLWLEEIVNNEHSFSNDEMVRWKAMLVKFGMYVSRSHGNLIQDFFAPFTEIFLEEKDGTKWKKLLNFKNKKKINSK